MKTETRFLLEMIKNILNSAETEMTAQGDAIDWKHLIQLAKSHSILHLIYYGLERIPTELRPDSETTQYLYQCAMREVVRSCNQTEGTEELLRAFEKEEIYVMAVKGVCTKTRYPQAELRSMGDIDILYKAHQNDQVKRAMAGLGYILDAEGRKHDHYSRKPYLNMEMHRELVATDSIYNTYYESVWDRAKQKEGFDFVYEMSLEDEYIYNIIHLVEHFQNGGVGIRFLMDVCIYNRMEDMDWDYVKREFETLGLWDFYQNISKLANVWFNPETKDVKEVDSTLDQMERYIIMNGTFGSQKNQAAVSVSKEGKLAFLLKTVFPNLKNMQSMFPWLEKWPILLPVSWGIRIVRSLLFRKDNVKAQLNKYQHGNAEYGKELEKFFEKCGL